jgi:hypothetical protein
MRKERNPFCFVCTNEEQLLAAFRAARCAKWRETRILFYFLWHHGRGQVYSTGEGFALLTDTGIIRAVIIAQ